jgi:hypothetical protein
MIVWTASFSPSWLFEALIVLYKRLSQSRSLRFQILKKINVHGSISVWWNEPQLFV